MAVPEVIADFARERFGSSVEVTMCPLRGGLEAEGIARVQVRDGGNAIGSFVSKPLSGAGIRELATYQHLAETEHKKVAPELLGWRQNGDEEHGYMFLEWITPDRRWPWRDLDASTMVVDRLAALHQSDPARFQEAVSALWDYETELQESAESTLDVYGSALVAGVKPGGRGMRRVLERTVANLQRLRSQLRTFTGAAVLHGDAHTGNAVMRKGSALLLDWARARIGSPLEDASSWIHSLAFWEIEARKKHDTLLKRYLIARGDGAELTRSVRDAFYLASASNAFAGALKYHLCVAMDEQQRPAMQLKSFRAAGDWLRIIRAADGCFTR